MDRYGHEALARQTADVLRNRLSLAGDHSRDKRGHVLVLFSGWHGVGNLARHDDLLPAILNVHDRRLPRYVDGDRYFANL